LCRRTRSPARRSAGVEHADPDLYSGKQVILTPIERTLTAKLKQAVDVWTALGCKVIQMSPERTTRPLPPSATCRT
jgi:hypothetical protein